MNKVFAFQGTDHKVGTTQIAQCCSEYIAEKYKDKKVMLIHCDGRKFDSVYVCGNRTGA